MRHWILDHGSEPPASWGEAMPEAMVLRRGKETKLPDGVPGIVWLRLAADEGIQAALADVQVAFPQRLVVLADEPYEGLVLEVLAAGAAGCCNTHAAPEVLRQVGLVVENGGLWVGQSLLQQLVSGTAGILGRLGKNSKNDNSLAGLSEREAQVARLVATGASNKEVAESLSITERTVKAHLTAIFEKLGLRDRLQLSVRMNGLEV